MTRKDYVAIAAAIKASRQRFAHIPQESFDYAITECAEQIAHVMSYDNPRFNRERFLAACGVQS